MDQNYQTYRLLKSKHCKSCMLLFTPKSGRQDYCNNECKKVYTQKCTNTRVLCCIQCNKNFTATGSTSKFCSKACRDLAYKLTNRKTRHCPDCNADMTLMQATKKFCTKECKMRYNSKQKYTGVEGIDYITCPLCFVRTRQFTPDHAAMHGYNTISEFAKDNNISVITCSSKKEKQSGENNPAFNHNGKMSSWSKHFINGYNKEKHQQQIEKHKKFLSESKDKFKTNIEYWLKLHSNDVKQATKSYKKFQRRDLTWFIEKYGEEEGTIRHRDKIEKWAKNFKKQNYSNISQELFVAILEKLPNFDHDDIFFATYDNTTMKDYQNKEYILKTTKSFVRPDFLYLSKKRIIEFDGTYWHSTAKANPERERLRDIAIAEQKYEILHVTEHDYKTNKEQVIQECINFLIK